MIEDRSSNLGLFSAGIRDVVSVWEEATSSR